MRRIVYINIIGDVPQGIIDIIRIALITAHLNYGDVARCHTERNGVICSEEVQPSE